MAVSPNVLGGFIITFNSSLVFNVFSGTTYYTTANHTLNTASGNYLKASSGTLIGSTDGRGLKGDFYDWTNGIYYRFSVLFRNATNVYYHIE